MCRNSEKYKSKRDVEKVMKEGFRSTFGREMSGKLLTSGSRSHSADNHSVVLGKKQKVAGVSSSEGLMGPPDIIKYQE